MKKLLLFIPKSKITAILVVSGLIILSIATALIADAFGRSCTLEGKTIVIDAGHGGVDSGANNRYILEKDVNLDVALRLQKVLERNGAMVVMTRTGDVELSKSKKFNRERYMEDLNARVDVINNSNANMFVSIHTNTNPKKPSTRGIIVLYSDCHPYNREIAFIFQNIFNVSEYMYRDKNYKNNHTPQKGEYYISNNSKIPGVIVETGFISNGTDVSLLQTPGYRQYIAERIYRGISDYLFVSDTFPLEVDYDKGIDYEDVISPAD